MDKLIDNLKSMLEGLDTAGQWFGLILLRLVLAKEFWDAGVGKLNGNNLFIALQDNFPFPFNLFAPEFNWHLTTGFEIVGAVALVLGLGTRFFALSLSILTLVAITALHAGNGYSISEGSWRLPLIYLAMLLPLILSGPGKLSLDHLLRHRYMRKQRRLWS